MSTLFKRSSIYMLLAVMLGAGLVAASPLGTLPAHASCSPYANTPYRDYTNVKVRASTYITCTGSGNAGTFRGSLYSRVANEGTYQHVTTRTQNGPFGSGSHYLFPERGCQAPVNYQVHARSTFQRAGSSGSVTRISSVLSTGSCGIY